MHEGTRKKEEVFRKGRKWTERGNVRRIPPYSYLTPKVFKNNFQVKYVFLLSI